VPHHGSIKHPLYEAVRDNPEFVFIDILDDSLLPLEQTLQSEVVISQSLHGLITRRVWASQVFGYRSETTKSGDSSSKTGTRQQSNLNRGQAAHYGQSKLSSPRRGSAAPISTRTPSRMHCPRTRRSRNRRISMNFRSCRKYNPAILFVDTLLSGRRYANGELSADILDALRKKNISGSLRFVQRLGRTQLLSRGAG